MNRQLSYRFVIRVVKLKSLEPLAITHSRIKLNQTERYHSC